MTHPGHRQQLDEQIPISLSKAGIGLAYHKRRLAELGPDGELLLSWHTEAGRSDVLAGAGWNIVGKTQVAYDAMILLARAIHLGGLTVRVVPLRRLIAQVMHEGDLYEELWDARALFITDFYQQYPGNETALTGREVQEVESFLIERLDDQKAVFVQSVTPIESAGWWSQSLLQRLHTTNRTLEVGEKK